MYYRDRFSTMYFQDPHLAAQLRAAQENNLRAVYGADTELARPVYWDDYWNKDRTLYGREETGLHYDYNDRLQSWDYAMFRVGQAYAKLKTPTFSANWWAAHLTAYNAQVASVVHILGGVNRATGYEYYAIGYKLGELLPASELVLLRRIAGKLADRNNRLPKRLVEARSRED